MGGRRSVQKPSKQKRKTQPERGYDFGVTRRSILVSGAEVVSDLFAATVQGCAYGSVRHPVLGEIPEIFLAAAHVEPLKRALAGLGAWDSADGDDGFDLHFLFLNDGGYLLGIAPNSVIIRNKIGGSDRMFEPLVTGPLFIKGMTTRQSFLSTFRAYIETGAITPFMFSGLQWTDPFTAPATVAGMHQILKFTARFAEEGGVTAGSFGEAMLSVYRGTVRRLIRKGRTFMRSASKTFTDVPRRRAAQLQRHFPVTVWRLSHAGTVADFRARHPSLPISSSQVLQAFVNLAISTEIIGDFHYRGIGRAHLSDAIHAKVSGRFELAGSSAGPTLGDEQVLRQIVLDGISLLQELGLKVKHSTPEHVLKLVDRHGLA